jgi:cytochrome c oxidase subunit 2
MNFFQEPLTATMDDIVLLHNWVLFYLSFILGCVVYIYVNILYYFFLIKEREDNELSFSFREILTLSNVRQLKHAATAETAWTIVPFMIVFWIMIPSLVLLIVTETEDDPSMTIKVVGHQWYWTYEAAPRELDSDLVFPISKITDMLDDYAYNNLPKDLPPGTIDLLKSMRPAKPEIYLPVTIAIKYIPIDSYIKPDQELDYGEFRLLEVNNALILPVDTDIRALVTATDVLHSWAVPAFGIKVDAVPGRLNQALFNLDYQGVFYGQCSELCGTGHGFMPIKVVVVGI